MLIYLINIYENCRYRKPDSQSTQISLAGRFLQVFFCLYTRGLNFRRNVRYTNSCASRYLLLYTTFWTYKLTRNTLKYAGGGASNCLLCKWVLVCGEWMNDDFVFGIWIVANFYDVSMLEAVKKCSYFA